MLHLIYLIAFTVLAFLAIGNLIRNLLSLSFDSQRCFSPSGKSPTQWGRNQVNANPSPAKSVPHPELLDDSGNPINEPLLVMRSMTVEDARQQLDAIYNSSPGNSKGKTEDNQ